jgi:short-subunit dehydrogenase
MESRTGVTTLVTGASAGIGREIARLAAADSRVLVLTARRRGNLEDLAAEITGTHPDVEVLVHACDLSEREARDGLLADLARRGLVVDHLVNNAGFGDAGPLTDQDAERHQRMVDLNVTGLVHLTSALYRGMVERGYGRVMQVASTAAFQPVPRLALYSATKAFVRSFSEALWREGRRHGVGVTCLCPGVTDTEFHDVGRGFRKKERGMPAFTVARIGYRGMLRGRRVVVPGAKNRLQTFVVAFVPKRMVLWAAEKKM